MSDELLTYYQQELAYFKEGAPEFARRYPDLARGLRLSPTSAAEIDDPHIERLIQAVAFLNARTRRKIDDEFSEISQALLQVLYPHYLAPFPSATIVRFGLSQDQAELGQGFSIPRESNLATDAIDGDPFRFRTCYPVTLWPIELTGASIQRSAIQLPATPWRDSVDTRVRLEVATLGRKAPIGALAFERLRFYINAAPQLAHQLYEAIFNNCVGVVVSGDENAGSTIPLERTCIQQVGFEPDDALVKVPPRSLPGYALLNEYFVFPQKFLFFEVSGLGRDALRRLEHCRAFTIDICLDRNLEPLGRNVTAQTFQLGCCPVVNLFSQRAESFKLTQHQPEYRVIPDARRPRAYEVHSIDKVVATSSDHRTVEFSPFYSLTHHRASDDDSAQFWHATRRPESFESADRTDVFVSLVDSQFSPHVATDWTIDVLTTCLNPRQLPFGGGQPRFQLESGGPLQPTACLVAPTRTLRPFQRSTMLWRLVSHLTLNHLSLVSPDASPEPLREILKLCDMADSEETRSLINGLLSVKAERSVARPVTPPASAMSARIAHRPSGLSAGVVCRGLDIALHFDEGRFAGNGLFLFGAVLERFLGMYVSINSFTRTTITTNRRPELCRWPARAGATGLL